MNQAEIKDWIASLPYHQTLKSRPCRNNNERITVLLDLLRHANEDGMSLEDRVICSEALRYLELEVRNGQKGERRERPCVSELQQTDPDRLEGNEEAFPCVLPRVTGVDQ